MWRRKRRLHLQYWWTRELRLHHKCENDKDMPPPLSKTTCQKDPGANYLQPTFNNRTIWWVSSRSRRYLFFLRLSEKKHLISNVGKFLSRKSECKKSFGFCWGISVVGTDFFTGNFAVTFSLCTTLREYTSFSLVFRPNSWTVREGRKEEGEGEIFRKSKREKASRTWRKLGERRWRYFLNTNFFSFCRFYLIFEKLCWKFWTVILGCCQKYISETVLMITKVSVQPCWFIANSGLFTYM